MAENESQRGPGQASGVPKAKPPEGGGSESSGSGSGGAGGMMSRIGSATGNAGAMGVGMAATAGKGSGRWVGSLFKRMGAMAVGMGTGLSDASGGMFSPKAGTGMGVGAIGLVMVLGTSMLGQAFDLKEVRREALAAICQELTEEAQTRAGNGDGSTTNEDMEEVAKEVYSVLSHIGMNDQNIAGILGNWSQESGIDPTSIQGIFDEPYKIGPRKEAKLAAGGFDGNSTGLGFGQWTGPRAQMLLDYAEEKDMDWYGVELQMAFLMGGDNPGDVEVFNKMVENESEGSDDPAAAAAYYHNKWERSADTDISHREKAAGEWYAKMGGWTVDAALGESVLALAGTAKRQAESKALVSELMECPGLSAASGGAGNANAAEAMVSFAWPFLDDSRGNDGTDLYMWVHDQVLEGDAYYASCDRGVASAVRWSGTDDNFPAGPVSAQEAYVHGEGSSKWEEVGNAHDESKLKPGDVLITVNHIEMYVGPEAVKSVWPNEKDHEPDAVIGHASLNDRSPALDSFGAVTNDGRTFTAFRSKGPEAKSKFVDIKAPAGMEPGKGNKDAATTTPGP